MKTLQKQSKIFARRKARIRAKIHGTSTRPRLSIFKSLKFIYAQIIDDDKGHTLVSSDTTNSKAKKPAEKAIELGADIAKKAIAAKIKRVVFDRNGYIYTGKIKAVADAAREGGLEF